MIHTMCHRLLLPTLAVAILHTICATAADTGQARVADGFIRTVALSGTPSPNDATAALFRPRLPVINNLGQVAFSSTLTGSAVDSSNDEAIWSEGSGQLEMPVREGMAAP